MSFGISFASIDDLEQFTTDLFHFDAKHLPSEVRNHFRTSRAMDYFKAYASFGLIEKYGYHAVAGLSFMAVVFEAVSEIYPRSSCNTSTFFITCMDISKSLCKDLLPKMNLDLSESTSLTMLFLKLAYQNRPAL